MKTLEAKKQFESACEDSAFSKMLHMRKRSVIGVDLARGESKTVKLLFESNKGMREKLRIISAIEL